MEKEALKDFNELKLIGERNITPLEARITEGEQTASNLESADYYNLSGHSYFFEKMTECVIL
ncbi:MAG: hypothetical protein K0Q51_1147 [Rickettsiaceae bacterium]|jgi:hypothetical protein|nr:hypothetical protein [Rickettsiaceae bacterium]